MYDAVYKYLRGTTGEDEDAQDKNETNESELVLGTAN